MMAASFSLARNGCDSQHRGPTSARIRVGLPGGLESKKKKNDATAIYYPKIIPKSAENAIGEYGICPYAICPYGISLLKIA